MSRRVPIRDGPAMRLLASVMLVVMLAVGWPGASFSATNTATDPGGGGVSLQPSGAVTVNGLQLALVKQARDLTGTVLPAMAPVASTQEIYFVLYVDNSTDVTARDIRITDLIDETQFTYVPNSLETTDVPSGSNDAAIWGGTWNPLSDAVSGADIASVTDFVNPPAGLDRMTVGAVTGQVNQTVDIPSGRLRAIRFRVTVN